MITINGQKMGKSLGNFINLNQFFNGEHAMLERPYNPMTIRFFIMQAHYRGTLDFSNEALIAAEKGMSKLNSADKLLDKLQGGISSSESISEWVQRCYDAMNDDLNTPKLIAELFDASRIINSVKDGHIQLTSEDIHTLKINFRTFYYEVLGIIPETQSNQGAEVTNQLMDLILEVRQDAKINKNWGVADMIRNKLTEAGIVVKDTKEGAIWEIKN